MSYFARLVATYISVFVLSLNALAESQLPDYDGNDVNDSCRTAINLGEIGYPQPRQVQKSEQLGTVFQNKFDSVDFYQFSISSNDYAVRFQTSENPPGTMYLRFLDASCQEFLPQSIGNDNEDVTYVLAAGTYYVVAAKGPSTRENSQYTLTVTPTIVPAFDTAGSSCSTAQNIGRISARNIRGALSPTDPVDAYTFFAPKYFWIRAFRQTFPKNYAVRIVDRLTGKRIELPNIETTVFFDPGFYCIIVEQPGINTTFNYTLVLEVQDFGYPSSLDRIETAGNLAGYDVGNLSSNGYMKDRYVDRHAPLTLVRAKQYVIREWVGANAREQWFRFNLQNRTTIQISLLNLLAAARTEIYRADGAFVGVTVAKDGASFTDRMIEQTARVQLEQGRYYLRTLYLSSRVPGTDYHLYLMTD
ncbi:MAG: hypothetical protein KDC45_03760 [Bacteroidetes bacterium]|nr:hypothetical protein [Bacteroidota bacterium]